MLSLKKGQKIYYNNKEYELLENAYDMQGSKENLFTAKVMIQDSAEQEKIRFFKFAPLTHRGLCGWLRSESMFQMSYPYIVKIYGGGKGKTEDDEEIFVLEEEWLKGKDLCDFLTYERPNPKDEKVKEAYEKDIFGFFLQLLYAANYYSKAEVYAETDTVRVRKDTYIHRDIKPENIMIVNRDGKKYAVLIDFDLAHIVGSNDTNRFFEQQDRQISNKPEDYKGIGGSEYTADPRAWGPYNLDIQADIYSMGRTFCECLLGKEWLASNSAERYFTSKEVQLIKNKMWELKVMKAERKPLPKDNDRKFYTDDWMKMTYGIDLDRLDPKYRASKYEKLLRMIRNMIAPIRHRYGDFETILKDMKAFLKEYYGEEKFYSMNICDQLLSRQQMKTDEKYKLCFFRIYEHGNGRDKKKAYSTYTELEQNEIVDICLGKNNETIATFYNKKGKLHYITYGKDVAAQTGKSYGEVVNGDEFQYNDLNVKIQFVEE